MVLEDYLKETMYINMDIAVAYVKIGPRAQELMSKKDIKLLIPMKSSTTNTTATATVSKVSKVDQHLKDLQDRCYAELIDVIRGIAGALDVSTGAIMNMIAIRAMSQQLPEDEKTMLAIPHVTKANFEKYGKALLSITKTYALQKNGKKINFS